MEAVRQEVYLFGIFRAKLKAVKTDTLLKVRNGQDLFVSTAGSASLTSRSGNVEELKEPWRVKGPINIWTLGRTIYHSSANQSK